MLVFDVFSPRAGEVDGHPQPAQRYDFTYLRLRSDGGNEHRPDHAFVEVDAMTGALTVRREGLLGGPKVRLNGVATRGATLRASDRLAWEDVQVHVLEVEAPPVGLVVDWPAVLASDETRAVFCDQLEASGAVRCADYARLAGRAALDADAQARLTALQPQVWRYFRTQVAKSPIRRCGLPQCPGTWEALDRSTTPARCGTCSGYVAFCSSEEEVKRPGRIALDPAVPFAPWMLNSMVQKGRPLIVEGVSETAALLPPPPPVSALVESLSEAARAEHASVATFARTLCELMALGAPLELLERTQAALADELRHTDLTLRQLERLGAASLTFGPLPSALAPLARPLAAFIADVKAGARFEQASTDEATREAARATDPQLRAFYQTIAGDEARHAQLALDTVTWLESRLG
jgi:hypothetical protein